MTSGTRRAYTQRHTEYGRRGIRHDFNNTIQGTVMRTTHRFIAFLLISAFSSPGWTTSRTSALVDVGLTGMTRWDVNDQVVEIWNVSALSVSASEPALADVGGAAPTDYLTASFLAPVKAIRYDDQARALLGLDLDGALRFSAPRGGGMSWGGMAEMSALTIDFATGTMSGSITGVNSLQQSVSYSGTIFSLERISYDPQQWMQGALVLDIQSLILNESARAAWIKALGGEGLLLDFTYKHITADHGTLRVSIGSSALDWSAPFVAPPSVAVAVPEPATWAMMSMGLLGLITATRQRALSRHHHDPHALTRKSLEVLS